jgi:hypothetical protein
MYKAYICIILLAWHCPSCYRGRGGTDANPQQAQFHARRSGGRDDSAFHLTVELCACARAMD